MYNHLGHNYAKVPLAIIRGDTFEHKLFEAVDVVDEDAEVLEYFPVDIRGYDYVFEIREEGVDHSDWFKTDTGLVLRAEDSHFSYGQTQKAIDYDIDQSNPVGTTFDELFLTLSNTETTINADDNYVWGLRRKQHTTEIVATLFADSKLKILQNTAEFSGS